MEDVSLLMVIMMMGIVILLLRYVMLLLVRLVTRLLLNVSHAILDFTYQEQHVFHVSLIAPNVQVGLTALCVNQATT